MMLWLLPDTPAQAKFLSPAQKIRAVDRVKANQTIIKSANFRWDHLLEGLTDIKVWLAVLFLLCTTTCNGSITAFSQIVLVGLGYEVSAYLLLFAFKSLRHSEPGPLIASTLKVYQANLFTIAIGAVHGFFGITAT